jgi:hypothetical protein
LINFIQILSLIRNVIKHYSFIILFSLVSCNTNEPPVEIVETNNRNYKWTIDTLYSGSGQTYLTSMWGSSSKNVWVCGYDAGNNMIYNFDGTNWNARTDIPITNFLKSFSEVTGVDSNFVIFAGSAAYLNNNPPPNFLDSSLILELIDVQRQKIIFGQVIEKEIFFILMETFGLKLIWGLKIYL